MRRVLKGSEHPLGEAIVRAAIDRGYQLCELQSFNAIPGHGIEVGIQGKQMLLGNKKLMIEKTIDVSSLSETSDQLAYDGNTNVYGN